MFKISNEKEELRAKVKSQALEITSLCRENDQFRFKIGTCLRKIKSFDHIRGNYFTLINQIEAELERDF